MIFAIVGLLIALIAWMGEYAAFLLLTPALAAAIYWMGFAVVDMATKFKRDDVLKERKNS